ncbi:MAG: hypothetical protein CMJ78_07580 [Planctomycetaceae bacterium]|nr:hypothetical protein [Planctomycetaceae bacterium]
MTVSSWNHPKTSCTNNLRRSKPIQTGTLFVILVILIAIIDRPLSGQNQPQSSRQVVIRECRVKLIDEAVLSSEQTGIIEIIDAQEGETLELGDRAVQIRDNVIRASLEVAEKLASDTVEIDFSEKASQLAQVRYEQALKANQQLDNTIPALELQELRLNVQKTLLQIDQARRNQEVAKLRRKETFETLQTYKVTAPFAGVVTKVHKKVGESVRMSDPILEIASTSRVRVEGFISSKDLHRVSRGAPVQVQLDNPNFYAGNKVPPALPGKIMYVDVKVEPVSNKVRVWAEVDNRSNVLRDGLTATMTVVPRIANRR